MVIIGSPSDISKYIALNCMDGFTVHQRGFAPKYRDGDLLYFKKSNKLCKILAELGISAEF